MKKFVKRLLFLILVILTIGFLIPESFSMPVESATKKDYNQNSYWYYPWGKSVTHKGVDIFAKKSTPVKSSGNGIVIKTGTSDQGGKYVVVLGPKWKMHYYAHLNEINTSSGSYVMAGEHIGSVGDTGNATGKAPHLHYSIYSLIPLPWKVDKSIQGWKKMFFIDPIPYLNESVSANSRVLSSEYVYSLPDVIKPT